MGEDVIVPEFETLKKIPRLKREVVITEKLDGTNAQVLITEDGTVYAGSRNRWITPGKGTDNYDFAGWVFRNVDVLREKLGPGRHFGEWWGAGIARKYDLTERRWSLFNTSRWGTWLGEGHPRPGELDGLPEIVQVVPTLYRGPLGDAAVEHSIQVLTDHGSFATRFDKPEGIVIHHLAAGQNFKWTFGGDGVSERKAPSPIENP